MNVTCPECQSVFRVDPAKVPATGVRARCSVCGGIIAIIGGTMPASLTPDGAAVVAAPLTFAGGGIATATPPRPQYDATPAAAVPPASATPPHQPVPPFQGWQATPSREQFTPAPSAGNAFAAPRRVAATMPPPLTPIGAPRQPSAAASTPAASPVSASPVSASPLYTPVAAATTSASPAGHPTPSGDSAPRRPINPFLRADPGERARRLARALVSDLVAYHPQKREEGLKNGTLRQLFRDEIKKSYEEFVDQVGRDVADSSTHFQDALNDILASGRKLF
jgi:predicted Zn finger-like uncharacterized protein